MSATLPLEPVYRQAGARIEDVDGVRVAVSFDAEPALEARRAREAVGLFDESWRGVVELRGADTADWLDRTTSARPGLLDDTRVQEACFLDSRGRLRAAFRLERAESGGHRAVLDGPMRAALIAELRKYAILSGVEVADRTGSLGILALRGPRADEALEGLAGAGELPGAPHELRRVEIGPARAALVRLREGGLEVRAEVADLPALWEALRAACASLGGAACGWMAAEALRVEAGRPRYGAEYTEESFPAEVGWERALTYEKCYIGQEIAARMRTYGEVHRRLVRIRAPGGERIEAAAPLFRGEEEAGRVTSAVGPPRCETSLGLALLARRHRGARELEARSGTSRTAVEVIEDLAPPIGAGEEAS